MKKIIFLGLLSFVFAALWQLPLSFAKPYAEKLVEGLKLDGVKGTVWKGSVQSLVAQNTDYGQVSWSVDPLQSLISLSLKSKFDIKGDQLSADGIAAITPTQKVILENTTFDVDAAYLNKLQKQAKLAGELQGKIHHAELEKNQLPVLDAIIDWRQATVSAALLNLSSGDYHATITPDENGLNIKPESKDGPLDISGNIKLSKEWLYQPDLKVNSKDPGLAGMLKFTGKPQNDGSVRITKSFDLKPFIKTK